MVIIKRIVHILAIISYVLIGIFVLVEAPMIFGHKPLIVLTGSMEPTLKVGSVIYYHQVPENELKKGDVITFELDDGTIITHRINSIENGEYETKGDANNHPDPIKSKYENIRGKVSKVSIPFIGSAFIFFLNNHTIIIGILVLILVSEFLTSNLEIFDINRKKIERKEEK